MWAIILFETKRGEKPVEEFIKTQEHQAIAKIGQEIDLLSQYGFLLGMPHSKKVTSDIYELRIRGKQEIRIFYSFVKQKIYLLHAFKKQTQKTPRQEISTAMNRLNKLT
ncbi:type II toxin-antitoxin system RelE/ParE family toxin [Candidatus Gottesmanbacteria bacterium]|nr:type II toxin-antitoxin system RelE/ParE family toxin [Candidatus Gottesmanbacteria bacterium]